MTEKEQIDIRFIAQTITNVTDKIDRVLIEQGSMKKAIETMTLDVKHHGDQLNQLVLVQHDQGKYIDGQIQQNVTEAGNIAATDQAKLGALYKAKYTFVYSLLSTCVVIVGLYAINKIFHLNLVSN